MNPLNALNPLNLLDLVARAQHQQPLTPGERAFLKTVKTLLLSAVAGALVAILQALVTHQGQPLTFAELGQIGEYAAVTAFLAGMTKLLGAQGDTSPLVAVINDVEQAIPRPSQAVPPAPSTPTAAAQPMRYSTPASGPISQRLVGAPPSGSFPPQMPDSPERRAELLRRAGIPTIADQMTRPTVAVNPAKSQPSQPRVPVMPVPAASAPSQPIVPVTPAVPLVGLGIPNDLPDELPDDEQPAVTPAPGHAADENGPPTMESPAVTAARDDAFLRQ